MAFSLTKRLLYHVLLAVFIANAANKFFIPDLNFELQHQFYQRIFKGVGYAPDQYRILPLLGLDAVWSLLKWIRPGSPWNHAVLVFNFLCGLLVLEGFYRIAPFWNAYKRLVFNFLFASFYIYSQYTGWRPDTLGLLLMCIGYVWIWQRNPNRRLIWSVPALLALSFSRSDVALIFALFQILYLEKNRRVGVVLLAIPVLTQLALQKIIFPNAPYYTHTVMILDNLSGFYLAYNPATWGLLAALLLFWKHIRQFCAWIYRQYPLLPGLLAMYVILVFIVGRINEYRLYLPFIPLLLYATAHPRKEAGSINGQS